MGNNFCGDVFALDGIAGKKDHKVPAFRVKYIQYVEGSRHDVHLIVNVEAFCSMTQLMHV